MARALLAPRFKGANEGIDVGPERDQDEVGRLPGLVEGELIRCGWAGSGLSVRDGRNICAALDAKRPIIVDVDHRGLTAAGELRHPVVKAWRVA